MYVGTMGIANCINCGTTTETVYIGLNRTSIYLCPPCASQVSKGIQETITDDDPPKLRG